MRERAYHIKLDPLLVDYDIKIPDISGDLSKAIVALIPCPKTYYHKLVRIDKCIYDPSVDINTLAVSIDTYRKNRECLMIMNQYVHLILYYGIKIFIYYLMILQYLWIKIRI